MNQYLCIFIFILHIFTVIKNVNTAEITIPNVHVLNDGDFYTIEYKNVPDGTNTLLTINSSAIQLPLHINNVLPLTEYAVNLTWWKKIGSEYSRELSNFSVISGPDPPENISVIIENEFIFLNWTEKEGADGYSVIVAETSGLFFEEKNITENFYQFNFEGRGQFNVNIATIYQDQLSPFVVKNIKAGLFPPSAIYVLDDEVNETSIAIGWDSDSQTPITFYNISLFLNNILIAKKTVFSNSSLEVAFDNLKPATYYNISISSNVDGSYSDPLFQTVVTAPLPPINLTIPPESVTSHSFRVVWIPPESIIDGYEVMWNRDQTAVVYLNTSYEIYNLEPGSTTIVSISSKRGTKSSRASEMEVTTKPLPVTGLTAQWLSQSSIWVKWQTEPDSDYKFKVICHKMSTKEVLFEKEVEADFCNITNVQSDSKYIIEVFTIKNDRLSNASVVEIDPKKENTDSRVNIEPFKNISAINIEILNNIPDQKVLVYYKRSDTGEINEYKGEGQFIKIGDLFGGAEYEINIVTDKMPGGNQSYYTFTYPAPPEYVSVEEVSLSSNSMKISWQPPQQSLVDSYMINYTSVSEGWYSLKDIKDNFKVLTNLVPATVYHIYIYSVSNGHQGMVPVKLDQSSRPSPPSDINVVPQTNYVTLKWKESNENISYYIINYTSIAKPEYKVKNVSTMPVNVSELFPGRNYNFIITSSANTVMSSPVNIESRTRPVCPIVMVQPLDKTEKISITCGRNAKSEFDKMFFEVDDPIVPRIERLSTETSDKLVVINNLTSGKLYNLFTYCSSGDLLSNKISQHIRLYPSPVKNYSASEITSTSVKISWDKPFGEFTQFNIKCNNKDFDSVNVTEYLCQDLHPYTNNTILIIVQSGGQDATQSTPLTIVIQTKEAAPGPVKKFLITDPKPYQVTLSWDEPMESNGILIDYILQYKETTLKDYTIINLPTDEKSKIIGYLAANHSYTFEINTRTKAGYGPLTFVNVMTPIWAPPPTKHIPQLIESTKTTLTIKFAKSFFDDYHGVVLYYIIIVAEIIAYDKNMVKLFSWSEVQGQNQWPPYQTSLPFNPFKNEDEIEYKIGNEKCTSEILYCNGPLKPGSTYSVKIRAFTDPNNYTDTNYSQFLTALDYTAYIIGVVVPVIVILILIIILSVMRRRKVGPFVKKAKEVSRSSREEKISITDSLSDKSRPVKIVDFPQHFHLMSADSDFRFSEEYEDLKHIGRDQPATAADLPVNRPKNRFTNILPYDHSRVKLLPTDDEEGSDYINANYMPGYRSPREFIVTQGPLHSTRDDMWRMIWEQNVRAIVMLTRCVEKGREKCDHYWPYDVEPVYYGDLQVTIMNESQFPDWTITEFKVSLGDQTHMVRHFHFTAWPDFGVPERPQTLIKFVRAFRERVSTDTRPIVVHCSAGVGRSGTFIVLDRLLQHIETHDYVDIFGIVYEMRKERVWMVQTEQQYICIHQCLLCVIEKKEDEPSLHPEAHENQGYDDDEGIAESGM